MIRKKVFEDYVAILIRKSLNPMDPNTIKAMRMEAEQAWKSLRNGRSKNRLSEGFPSLNKALEKNGLHFKNDKEFRLWIFEQEWKEA